jgi:hypothetical protein
MVLGGATFQDTVIDDKIKPKAKVPSEARRVPSRTEGPPRWAKLAGTKYMDWFKRHTDKDMCKNMLNMMTKPAHHHALDREIDLIKAIQQFNGIKRVENEKMGWNEADFTVWLFLEFEGKVKKYPNKWFNVLILGPLEFVRVRILFMSELLSS